MSDLTQNLRVFVKVADHKNFAAAGRELNMANSSVTRQIANLEKELGVSLFVRTTRLVRLSPAGERAYEHAQDVLSKVEDLRRDVHAFDGRVSGLLRVSVPWRYARLYIAPILTGFMQQYPDIRIEVVSDDKMVNLVDAGFDAAIRIGRLSDSSLIAKKIGEQSFVMVAAPNYLATHAPITTHAELDGHTILTFSYSTANYTWKLKQGDQTFRIPAKQGALATNNADLITAAAVSGAGIVIQPDWAVQDQIKDGRLVPLLTDYEVTSTAFETGVYVVFAKENGSNPCVRAWVDYVSEHFRHCQILN